MYKRELQQTARKSLFLKLLHLPYGILIPILISTEVTNALAGKTKSVLTTAAGILAIVFCYTYFYGRLEIAFRKEKEQAVQACKMKQYRTIFANSFEKLYHSGLGKNLENMKDDFNAVTELMTEHRPMFAASLAEAVLFGGYLCWKNPLVGICLILISLLQVIPPLLVKKYIQVNYDNCREIEGKITDYTVSAFQGFMTIKLYQLKDWWLSHLEELFQAYIKIGSNSIFANRSEVGMYAVLDHVLKYGTYCLIGVFVLFGKTNLETGIQAIALSGNIYAAVKSAFEIYPRFVESSRAQKRLEEWENASAPSAALPTRMEIEWRGVSFSYDRPVLKNVTARMDLTQNHIIRGENGAGKSTLIKLLLKELDSTSGTIIVSGEKLEGMKHRRVAKYRRKLGVVFQDFRLLKDRDVYENVAFAQRVVNRPTRVIRKRVPEVLQEVGLAGKYKAYPDELSGGEQQRVALARAIVNRPDILLADEPTGNLDPKTSEEIMKLLEEINQRGTTVLVVTHNKEIVNSMKKRVLTMHNGVIISDEKEGEYYEA